MRCCNIQKLSTLLQCNHNLNKKAIHIKKCWDEVAALLNHACDCHGKKHKR